MDVEDLKLINKVLYKRWMNTLILNKISNYRNDMFMLQTFRQFVYLSHLLHNRSENILIVWQYLIAGGCW